MVVKMMRWSPWQPASAAAAKKFQVRVKQMKLEGFSDDDGDGDNREKVMVIKMRWKGSPKPGLVPFHRPPSSKHRKHISNETIVKKGEPIEWADEFENVCSFPITSKDNTFGPWDASFTLFYGAKTEAKAKLAVVGKVSLNLAEMASKMDALIETKLPVDFQVAGVAREATLSVCLSFVEVRNSQDSPAIVQNSTHESKNVEGSSVDNDEGKEKQSQEAVSSDYSDESGVFDSEGTPENELDVMTRRADVSSVTESGSGPSSDAQCDSVKKAGLFSWKRRKLSFKPGKTKVGPLIKKTSDSDGDGDGDGNGDENEIDDVDRQRQRSGSSSIDSTTSNLRPKLDTTEQSCESGEQEESSTTGHWEEKELVSRDGQAKLKANVFFASFDQRSDKAAGESACTALVAIIAHWLHSNQDDMPTRSEFDRLIVEGSSEWRKLSDNEDFINSFPDKHFDLETVLQAGLRPISVLGEKSVVGCFGPEKFEHLKEAMSFDQIWDEINSNITEGNRPRIYIVSWNDHFFVLKVDANAYYIIDTLGERLFEGCNQAYILRFDNSALMHGKVERENISSEEMSGTEPTKPEEITEEEICSGKECCREFIKRFLAAIPLRELELEEEKEPVPYLTLLQRLQIEFNFSSSL